MTPNFTPEPTSVWVTTDIDIDINMKAGSVPKTLDDLVHFSERLNKFLISHGAHYANYVLFGDDAQPVASLECEF